ncbi:transcriptional regulator [Turicibacter faecis]|uniref:Transcriptional regulator n=2 Tax=Turicibacter TaxID=191303 RepID=A0ABN6ZDL5_9FIRM|nr:transcriptional regulator [Turicibacter sp. TC023]
MGERIMIASQSEKLVSSIRSQVTSSGYEVVGMASNGYDLIRRCKALAPAVVIVDEELPGMSVISLVEILIQQRQAVLLVGMSYQKFYYRQDPYFEFCEKPVQPVVLLTMLRVLVKYGQTVRQLESKVNHLEKLQKEEKTIRLAKRALQQNERMSEDEAHRYIQKRSMELRISKLEVAEIILKKVRKKVDFRG